MARTPRAARTLTRQVRERLNRKPDSKAGAETSVPIDEPDGLGVHRQFLFDKVASKGLADLLTTASDTRIVGVEETKDGVVVTFAPTTIADDDRDFDLATASAALEEPPETT